MQEGTIGWDPIGEYRLPWQGKLLVLYLLIVTAVLVARSIMLVGDIRALHTGNDKFTHIWEMTMARVASMKRLALLTLLLSVLCTVNSAVHVLVKIQEMHSAGPGAIAGATSEVLTLFELGLFVCTALYAVASLYEGALARRRASWNYSSSQARRADSQ